MYNHNNVKNAKITKKTTQLLQHFNKQKIATKACSNNSKMRRLYPKNVFVLLAYASVVLVFIIAFKVYFSDWDDKSPLFCYDLNTTSLPDILDTKIPPGQSIFFHETSCNSHRTGKIILHKRQACAVESAALLNPNHSVYLLYTSPGILIHEHTESDRILRAILTYKNIHLKRVNLRRYAKNTPVEKLLNGTLQQSEYAQSHASDILRYLTLWRYGGIYLDLDVVVTRPFDNLVGDFSGAESYENVAAGVMRFAHDGKGHEFAKACLEDLAKNYTANEWGYNGPGVITRLARKLCGTMYAIDMIGRECAGFKVYSPRYFYPITWHDWMKYFETSSDEGFIKYLTESYVIHVWNKHSSDYKIPLNSTTPYTYFAQRFCPKVYRECDDYF